MGARAFSCCAAAVFAAAVVVYGVLRGRERRLRREAVSERLMAGCASRDVVALREQVEAFRVRLGGVVDGVPSSPASPSPGVPSVPGPVASSFSPPPAPPAPVSSVSSFSSPVSEGGSR